MIQRKQSIYLFIAALLGTGVFYFGLYNYHTGDAASGIAQQLRVTDNFPLLLIALLMISLPLVSIFLFRNRKLQARLSLFGILSNIAFTALFLWLVNNINKLVPPPTGGYFWIGSVLPVIAVVFLFLAIAGIRKDDKLVKSVDRLR